MKCTKQIVIIKIGVLYGVVVYQDYLKIQNLKNDCKLNINFGYVDRVAGMFDFQKSVHQNITGYKLMLDIENTDCKTLKELESAIHSEGKAIEAIISLDGIVSKGRAKISKMFSIDGASYDVEITN